MTKNLRVIYQQLSTAHCMLLRSKTISLKNNKTSFGTLFLKVQWTICYFKRII